MSRPPTAPTAADPGPAVVEHLAWMRLRGLSEKTIISREQIIRLLAINTGRPPLEVTAADLQAWQRMPGWLTLTPATRETYVSHLRMCFRWCADGGLIATNPAKVLVKPKVPQRKPKPISEADLTLALSRVPPVVRTWLVLAAYCGLRCAEIAALAREDVLDGAGLLRVTGKGDKQRYVPLPPAVYAVLLAHGLPEAGPVFRRDDGSPETGRHISAAGNRWLHRLGISATMHRGRHRFATAFYRDSRDILATRDVLGHALVTTTQGYAAPDEQVTVATVHRLSERLAVPA